jgi:hypothetical protein
MMAHAGRDPIFWATVAIAEQDFDGAGDLCIRCHAVEGWIGGRSTPTDGSGLAAGDDEGVQCDVCHRLTNPDDSEHLGVQLGSFIANDGNTPPTGYYGGGMYVIWDGNDKLGPYIDADAKHQFMQSLFHRSGELCGTCHDVSNPVVGDLAHNNGAQVPLPEGSFSGTPGAPVEEKAAFKNFPYRYGVVERTFSEWKSSEWPTRRVSEYANLPAELQSGSIQTARDAALLAGTGGDYEDLTPRYYTCQTCHMRPTVGEGCNKQNVPRRHDLPLHDMTGGNYWAPLATQYLDAKVPSQLVLGDGLTGEQIAAMDAGALRARQNLVEAASLSLQGNSLRITNLTGHKLISGYPEGRRMWLTVRWFDPNDALIVEDGAYGELTVDIDGTPTQVETLLDLHDPYTRVYEAHGAMTQEWALQLRDLGYPEGLPLVYDRESGQVTVTLGDLAAQAPGTYRETFHFVLVNYMASDNRIPPFGMRYDDAVERNILPVPSGQYGNPGTGEVFNHWDDVLLNPPPGASRAEIELRYQPTSWEYIQFLYLRNERQNAFLGQEGVRILDAWLNTDLAYPQVMASTPWANATPACSDGVDNDGDGLVDWNADPGCDSASDESENSLAYECDDRIDNDGDGLRDYPNDPVCSSPTGASESDSDGDGILDDGDDSGVVGDAPCTAGQTTGCDDNCLYEPNPDQADPGGTSGAGPDGIGTVCQCGDPSDDGQISLADFVLARRFIASGGTVPPTPEFVEEKCDVSGDQACSLADVVLIRRAVAAGTNHNPLIIQGCTPALP